MLELLSETACRRSEVLSLTVNDVNLPKRYFTLERTKNGSSRTVPLSKRAVEILSEAIDKGKTRLFPLNGDYVSKELRKVADRLGMPEFVVHSLRHYRLTKLIAAGHDHLLVATVSGHKDVRTLKRYVKQDLEGMLKMFDN